MPVCIAIGTGTVGTLAVKGLETGAVIGGLGMALPGPVSLVSSKVDRTTVSLIE